MEKKSIFYERQKEYYEIEKKLIPKFPKNMLLEVTNVCNHSCIFCANSKSSRKKGFIEKKFAKRILCEAYDLGTREVGFYSTGEPLMNKDLEFYIKLAKQIGFEYVYITTNGALLDKNRMESIIASGIDSIKFSINAGTVETYNFIHGKNEFNKVFENLKNLYNYREEKKLDFKIYMSCILTSYTVSEKELIKNIFNSYTDEIIFLNCKNQCGVMYEINGRLTIDDQNQKEEMCSLPFNKLHITYEGYLTACCADFQNYLVVADLNNTKLEDAWKNEIFMNLRKKHIENNLDYTLCFNCINNTNSNIKPLIQNLAIEINKYDFDKTKEIEERIEEYSEKH